ncbi:ATP-binding protein [candidate division KSB1 bacterium]
MKNSIFTKIFTGYILLTVVIAVLIIFFVFNKLNDFYIDQQRNDIQRLSYALEPSLSDLINNNMTDRIDEFLDEQSPVINTRLTLIDEKGIVLGDSEKDPDTMENHRYRPEISDAIENGSGWSIRYSETLEHDMMYVAVRFIVDTGDSYVLRSSLYINDITALLNTIKTDIIESVLLVLFTMLLISVFISRGISKPVKLLAQSFQKVARGEFKARMNIERNDEIGQLSGSFNTMAAQLEILFEKFREKNEELDSLIGSMQEGLLLLNKDGKILLNNNSFNSIVDQQDIVDKSYWEVIRETGFNEFISKAINEKRDITEELELEDKNYICSVTFIKSKEEILVIFYDISELKRFDMLKKDLVVNVSHELHTPLTAIKGYLETLQEDSKGEQKKFIEIISRNTERLIRIVKELLTLSEVEDTNIEQTFEETDIGQVIQKTDLLFEQKIKNKGLKLSVNIEEGLRKLFADPFKLEQLFINLVENAINYTESGDIEVSAVNSDGGVKISVKDTGIGIDKEHLSRIFERFYVVNKARSRNMGGTGLGLSIVKHIVILHKGSIDVKSRPGEGTEFIISFPIK